MTDTTPLPQRSLSATLSTIVIVVLGLGLASIAVWIEYRTGLQDVDWVLFAVISGFLLLCERSPRFWIRFGGGSTLTPIWLFAYALMLLGSPSAAIIVGIVGSIVHSFTDKEKVLARLQRIGGVALTLSAAGLSFYSTGVVGPITSHDTIPWDWAVMIIVAGVLMVILNVIITSITTSTRRSFAFLGQLRRSVKSHISSEGALVSLAPLWVLGIDSSPVLIPLLAITTTLVFRSARQALERAHEAHHDPLTGLMNRRAFLEHVDDVTSTPGSESHCTLLLLDLNGFKEINDRLGHPIGDAMLIAFAERLVAEIPPNSVAARLGGDEFAVLVSPGGPQREPIEQTLVLHAALTTPLKIEGFPVSVGVSIGISTSPAHGLTTSDLIRAADIAMYRAKRSGTPVEHYDSCAQSTPRGSIGLLGELGKAIDNHELRIHFQPQIRTKDGQVDTVEALVRWQHPQHGLVAPDNFIGLAEQTDLIGPITNVVLRLAASGLRMADTTGLKLAINVSARSLQNRQFAHEVLDVLDETGLPPHRLELEVTERALVTNPERSAYTIKRLRDAGVRFAIDDFGSGYSSYQTLRTLQVDRVKIDRDFIANMLSQPNDRVIVQSVIDLAHRLGLDVVAEGVESTVVWDAVAQMGCDVAQGYGIAVPMAFPDLRGWLANWNGRALDRISAN